MQSLPGQPCGEVRPLCGFNISRAVWGQQQRLRARSLKQAGNTLFVPSVSAFMPWALTFCAKRPDVPHALRDMPPQPLDVLPLADAPRDTPGELPEDCEVELRRSDNDSDSSPSSEDIMVRRSLSRSPSAKIQTSCFRAIVAKLRAQATKRHRLSLSSSCRSIASEAAAMSATNSAPSAGSDSQSQSRALPVCRNLSVHDFNAVAALAPGSQGPQGLTFFSYEESAALVSSNETSPRLFVASDCAIANDLSCPLGNCHRSDFRSKISTFRKRHMCAISGPESVPSQSELNFKRRRVSSEATEAALTLVS